VKNWLLSQTTTGLCQTLTDEHIYLFRQGVHAISAAWQTPDFIPFRVGFLLLLGLIIDDQS